MHHLKIPVYSFPPQKVRFFPVGNFMVFRTVGLMLLFFVYSFCYAAETTELVPPQQVLLTVSGNAQVYSSDENFNHQILSGQIVTDNHTVVKKSTEDEERALTVTSSPSSVPISPFTPYARTQKAAPLQKLKRRELSSESTPKAVPTFFIKRLPDSTRLAASAFMRGDCGVAAPLPYHETPASAVSETRSISCFYYVERPQCVFYFNRFSRCHFISFFPVRPPPAPVKILFEV